ncbi:MAG TPA: electron transporter RnfD [Verrucomicrobia bacterium]|nr:electron transporter RnfD [Verrucomicrobiota bacterium]
MSNDTQPYFIVSTAPHTHSGSSVRRIMLDVIIALMPAVLASFYLFGWHAVRLTAVCVLGCVGTEALCRRLMGRDLGIGDLSAVVTGLLLAMNLPPALPSGMALVGCVIAIAIAKQVFGGIGYNPFNPALVARVALLMSFPVAMTRWHDALNPARWLGFAWTVPDATTTATPLGLVKTALTMKQPLPLTWDNSTMLDYLLGNMSGCIGEVSALALLLGAGYLLFRRCITWHIPVTYIGTVAIFAAILRVVDPATNMPVSFHMLSGGLMLGALFMATDMVTSPLTRRGQLVFGAGCGLLTILIRRWGGYPEGVSFAILLMNALTPLINQATRPGIFGQSRKKK